MIKDLHFNRDFIKIDLMRYDITEGYIQNPGMTIVNLDRIDMIAKSGVGEMYTLHIANICYYINEEQFKTLCEKL